MFQLLVKHLRLVVDGLVTLDGKELKVLFPKTLTLLSNLLETTCQKLLISARILKIQNPLKNHQWPSCLLLEAMTMMMRKRKMKAMKKKTRKRLKKMTQFGDSMTEMSFCTISPLVPLLSN